MNKTFKPVKTRDRSETTMPKGLRLAQMRRIENTELWKRYATERFAVQKKRPHKCTPTETFCGELQTAGEMSSWKDGLKAGINEAFLWHGTSLDAATSIMQAGFRLDLAGSA